MKDFINKVLLNFTENITDRVFLSIQNDNELLREYLKLISAKRNDFGIDQINQEIGRAVKEVFDLDNIEELGKPQSSLILSTYTRHRPKKTG